MLLCFRCSPETKDHLDGLVASGSYRDESEVIAAAVANLAVLEKEVASQGGLIIGSRTRNGCDDRPKASVVTASQHAMRSAARTPQAGGNGPSVKRGTGVLTTPAPPIAQKLEVPSIFQLTSMPQTQPRGLADLPGDMWQHGQQVPLDRWILGQFNRLLPVKANCRALIHLFQQNGAISIKLAADQVALDALNLGDYLASIDEDHALQRDDALSTAFPQRKKDSDKARTRYANQFVAYQNGRGELSGLMIDLKLINVDTRRRERRIVPTHMAWELAKLENPILDGVVNGAVHRFSEDEKGLLIEHILVGVPVESFAYRAILEAVMAGHNTPETIDTFLQQYVSRDRAEKLSQSFLASQRSGAISRMSDLGLIERQRDGTRVSYGIPKEGREFLSHYDRRR